jgi:hypothetical protein
MFGRPLPLLGTAVLLAIIGVSGTAAAGFVALASGGTSGVTADVRQAGGLIGMAMGAYAVALLVAAAGLIAFRRWAVWLGVVAIGLGLAALTVSVAIAGPDPVLTFGLLVWGLTLGLLLAPGTQQATKRST